MTAATVATTERAQPSCETWTRWPGRIHESPVPRLATAAHPLHRATAHCSGLTARTKAPTHGGKQTRQSDIGGEGAIRTHVPLARQDAFEAPPLRPLRYLSAVVCCSLPAALRAALPASVPIRHGAKLPTASERDPPTGFLSRKLLRPTLPQRRKGGLNFLSLILRGSWSHVDQPRNVARTRRRPARPARSSEGRRRQPSARRRERG